MGQSLSNLCGLKPAEPKQWPQFEAKMKSEVRPCRAATLLHPYLATHPYLSTPSPQGLSDAAIAAFKHNFVTLASGANLMISEEPPQVKPGDWPAAGRPSAADLCPARRGSGRLGSVYLRSNVSAEYMRPVCPRGLASAGPASARRGSVRLRQCTCLLLTHASRRSCRSSTC